jgi:murein DD-endopeptidase MepM/ murein hydrolase activator NlpD
VVEDSGEDREYGRYVRILHDGGLRSLYAHASWVFAAEGDTVEAGDVIALSGNTGRSTAPHLHLEVEQDGEPVDPLPWVSGRI